MLELRSPQLLAHLLPGSDRSYVLLFAEGAHLRVLQPLPDQEYKYTLASAGIGMRFRWNGLSLSLDGARTFKDGYVTLADRYRGRTVLVATHVTPIKSFVRDVLGAPSSALFRMELAPASITVVQWYADGVGSLRAFNHTAHLVDGQPGL